MMPQDEGTRRFLYEELARYAHEIKHQFLRWMTTTPGEDWLYWDRNWESSGAGRESQSASPYL